MKIPPSCRLLVFTNQGFQIFSQQEYATYQPPLVTEPTILNKDNWLTELANCWPNIKHQSPIAVKSLLVVLPDHWLTSTIASLTISPNNYLLSLAALSIASETSHLAPERLCYSYRVEKTSPLEKATIETTHQQIKVWVHPIEWWRELEAIFSSTKLLGTLPLSEFLSDRVHSLFQQTTRSGFSAPVLSPYEPSKWHLSKQLSYWKRLLVLSCAVQLFGAISYYALDYQQLTQTEAYRLLSQKNLPLAAPQTAAIYQKAFTATSSLPSNIRLNRLLFDKTGLTLDVDTNRSSLITLMTRLADTLPMLTLSSNVTFENTPLGAVENATIQIKK